MDEAGTIHLLYYLRSASHGDLFYVKSSDSGVTWSAPLLVNSEAGTAIAAGTIRGGQIAVGKNGRVHVAWNGSSKAEPQAEPKQTGRAPMLYSRLNDARTAFEPERNLITRTFNLDGGGAVAADSRGNVMSLGTETRPARTRTKPDGRSGWPFRVMTGKPLLPSNPLPKNPLAPAGVVVWRSLPITRGRFGRSIVLQRRMSTAIFTF